jgi:hypothetical protein
VRQQTHSNQVSVEGGATPVIAIAGMSFCCHAIPLALQQRFWIYCVVPLGIHAGRSLHNQSIEFDRLKCGGNTFCSGTDATTSTVSLLLLMVSLQWAEDRP